jgi:hypothetical protein
VSELTLADLGHTSEQSSMLPAEHAQMLAATLDVAFDSILTLPLLWHWAYFNPVVGTAGLGPDGHPRREAVAGDFPLRCGLAERSGPKVLYGLIRSRSAVVAWSATPASTVPPVSCWS